jgi:Ser/Thr protein kinase RdoA (MazF antagonist)
VSNSSNHQINQLQNDYYALKPEIVIDAVESLAMHSDLRIIILNSYENRVYQVGIEEETPVIAKFYRPNRWTDEQILEEHQLTLDLVRQEIPVIAPLIFNGKTIHYYHGYRFSLYPRRGGHAPELSDMDHLLSIGHFLGQIHAMNASKTFKFRPSITLQSYVVEPSNLILEKFIPKDLEEAYRTLIKDISEILHQTFNTIDYTSIRLHGDCHPGNILWRDNGPHFLDFDDSRMGPAMQDIWMLLSGDRQEQTLQLMEIVEGYNEFHDFNPAELRLIEPLRTMRMIYYAGWIAKRWNDPAFPHNFTWFNTPSYWSEHILQLREQFSALQEAPLKLAP